MTLMDFLQNVLGGGGHARRAQRRIPLVSSVSKKKKTKLSWKDRIVNMPILQVYKYLWNNDRKQLFWSIFFNYLYPLLLDALPFYYLSQRKIAQRLRQTKTNVNTRMVQSAPFAAGLLKEYALLTLIYALLSTFRFQVQQRMSHQQVCLVKRMVTEKLLHSELGELENILGNNNTAALEARVMQDINKTMHLVSFVMPTLAGAVYTLVQESSALFKIRHRIDPLVLLRPVLIGFVSQAAESLKYRVWDKRERKLLKQNERESSQLLQGISEGLAEIQVNSLQASQLEAHDMLTANELENKHGLNVYVTKVLNTLTNRSLLDFASEVWVVHYTMKKRHLNYAQYSRIAADVGHVARLGLKILRNISTGYSAIRDQSKVIRILKIPNFLNEEQMLVKDVHPFKQIRVHDIKFRYPQQDPDLPPNAPALDFKADLVFETGVTYALLGRNGCGKSTLLQLVCKLQNKIERGTLHVNSIPYQQVSRTALRSLVSYVSQRPYIFPGNIYENIAVASPSASPHEVFEAALAAGLFAVDNESTASQASSSFSCKCRREFHVGASLRPQSKRMRHRHPSSQPQFSKSVVGCDQCIWGRLMPYDQHSEADPQISGETGPLRARGEAILKRETGARGALLSGGMMQSVALARVLLRKSASIVILDEAFGQMDAVKKREVILPKLLQFVRGHDMTLIMVTHEVEIARYMDHIIVLDAGSVQHQGTHEQLMASQAPAYIKLLGEDTI